ncbi:MAG: response regulator [Rhodospirillales bacterium]
MVAHVPTGTLAASRLKQDHADVVVMDIGMQELDGLKAIPRLLLANPDVKIVMVATLTFRNVKISMDGLVAGAVEFVTLPVSRNKKSVDLKFRLELTSKIKALGSVSRRPVAERKITPSKRAEN